MNATAGVLVVLTTAILGLDAWAVQRAFTSSYYERAQRMAQLGLILCVPVIGACLAIYLAREDMPARRTPPIDHLPEMSSDMSDAGHHDHTGLAHDVFD